jgi:hypothetical protein
MHISEIDAIMKGRVDDQPFPPRNEQSRIAKVRLYRRYLVNDADDMFAHRPELHVEGDAERTQKKSEYFTPVPLARSIFRTSAQLMFTVAPKLSYGEGREIEQRHLDEWSAFNDLRKFLFKSAQQVAAEGTGALRVVRDDNVSERFPLVDFQPADCVFWVERYGRFTDGGVVLVEIKHDTNEVWRLFEHHGSGFVRRVLYKGTSTHTGKAVSLAAGPPQFRELAPHSETGINRPTLIKWDNNSDAVSDIAGSETLVDELNDGETIGRKKLERSQSTTFMHRAFVNSDGDEAPFDLSGVYHTGGRGELDNPVDTLGDPPLTHVQPRFDSEDQIRYLDHVRELIVTLSGYSMSSWGLSEGGRVDSGRALELRMVSTLLTKLGKDAEAKEAISAAAGISMALMLGRSEIEPFIPEVELGDGMPVDEVEQAQTLKTLKDAGAISQEEMIRTLHPDWDDARIQAEVAAIGAGGSRAGRSLLDRINEQKEVS